MKKFEKALDSFNMALKIMPDCSRTIGLKGRVYEYLAQYDKAFEYYDKSISISSSNFRITKKFINIIFCAFIS
jgi:tetratricopeptide (TPR) repeat protein